MLSAPLGLAKPMRPKRHAQHALPAPRAVLESAIGAEVTEYPSSDGEPMALDNRQLRSITYSIEALAAHFRDRPEVHVRGDMFIYYERLREGMSPSAVSVVPDVFVVIGDIEVPESSYKLWEVGVVPQFVMEVSSQSSYHRDVVKKHALYERLGFEEYWWFDSRRSELRVGDGLERVRGWRLESDGKYREVAAGAGGELRSQVLQLDLCSVGGRLRFWDYRNTRFLDDLKESEVARQRAEADRARAETARQRAEAERAHAEATRRRLERQLAAAQAEAAKLRESLRSARIADGSGE